MRILLINPSILTEEVGHYPGTMEKKRGVYPVLGLLWIAAALEEAGHVVRVIDFDIEERPWPQFDHALRFFAPDLVGFYAMTWTFRTVTRLAERVRRLRPSATVIAGGPNVTSFPQLSVELAGLDFGVVDEGEQTVVELAGAIESGGDPTQIRGLVIPGDNGPVRTPPRPYADVNELPMPARHLVPIRRYHDVLTSERRFTTMVSSRGCPFSCIFCDRINRMGKKWRQRSPAKIVEEMEEVRDRYGIREIAFSDDEFIIDKRTIHELCELLASRDHGLLWECRARPDMVDEELLRALRRAGCYRIRFGFESGNDHILEVLHKDLTVAQSLRAAQWAKRAGIEVFGYFMIGSPQETQSTVQDTIDLALRMEPDFAVFSKTIMIPKTPLFQWGVEQGLIAADYWERFLRGEESDPAPAVSTAALPLAKVDEAIARANRSFYLRSRYILRRLSRIRGARQLGSHVSMARAMFHG